MEIDGNKNTQLGGSLHSESEQGIGNIDKSKVVGANINGSNISINELPYELLILLVKIIQQLINERNDKS